MCIDFAGGKFRCDEASTSPISDWIDGWVMCVSSLVIVPFTQLQTIFLITFLYGIAQFLVARNYAVANIFLNPMALMLSTLIRGAYLMSLIEYRFLGIIIGSFIGLGVAWVMNVGLQHYLNVVRKKLE